MVNIDAVINEFSDHLMEQGYHTTEKDRKVLREFLLGIYEDVSEALLTSEVERLMEISTCPSTPQS
jgi:hypothetical protein